jgi:hypothetical protein
MNGQDEGCYLPTEEEIAAACQEVQATWNRREERRRRAWAIPPPMMVPEVEGSGELVE